MHDWVVVGGGIVGQAVARSAAKRGERVVVLEKEPNAFGASIRNFGMVWPMGQPVGPPRTMALRNRELWLEYASDAGFPILRCGSLHLAHHSDELAVLEQWLERERREDSEHPARLLSAPETLEFSGAVNPEGLKGSLFSPWECRVDPREAVQRGLEYLGTLPNVDVCRDTNVVDVDGQTVRSADGRRWNGQRIVIASGAEFRTLLPELYARFKLRRCKLHMLRVAPPDPSFALGPHLASGLTLRHYAAFEGLPALQDVKQRFAESAPELDRFGIHVMMSQAADGELVLGDSHQYDEDIDPMNNELIDDYILRECRKVFRFPGQVTKRWTGIYAKYTRPWLAFPFSDQGYVLNGFGGAGMTLSLAAGERLVADITKGCTVPIGHEFPWDVELSENAKPAYNHQGEEA